MGFNSAFKGLTVSPTWLDMTSHS